VRAADGHIVGVGYANPRTTIAVRLVTHADEPLDAALIARRVDEAIALRRTLLPEATAYRLVNGEGDRLPGVVVDRYGDVLVYQLLTAGAARLATVLTDALVARLAPRTVYERSEGAVRREEGLADATGVRYGAGAFVRIAIRISVRRVEGQRCNARRLPERQHEDSRRHVLRIRGHVLARCEIGDFARTERLSVECDRLGAGDR